MSGQLEGAQFEAIFERECIRKLIGAIRLKNSTYVHGHGVVSVPAPFDWVTVYKGKSAYIDTKSYEDDALPHSHIKAHQLKELTKTEYHGHTSGYLVWHRSINQVVFYSAGVLNTIKEGESVKPDQGISLGKIENMNLRLLFERRKTSRRAA